MPINSSEVAGHLIVPLHFLVGWQQKYGARIYTR